MPAASTPHARPANAAGDWLAALAGRLICVISKPLEAHHLSLELYAASRLLVPDGEQ